MTTIRVDILCECEGCQKRFGVEAELARELNNEAWPDFDALAREEIRNRGEGYVWGVRGKATVDRFPIGWVTIQADLMLCDECTKKCDDLEGVPEDRNLTRAEVNKALGLHGETT